jgi:hypothetical protein
MESTVASTIRRKRVKVVTDDNIRKQIEILRGENKKKAIKVKKVLASMDPQQLVTLGLTEDELASFPSASLVRTWRFGTLGVLYSGDDKVPVGDGTITAFPHQRDMRATDEYYNTIVTTTRPLFLDLNRLLDGDEQQKLRSINEDISQKWKAIKEINQTLRRRVTSVEVEEHLSSIKELKALRNPLYATARKERLDKKKVNKDALDIFKQEVTKAIRLCRNNRPEGIWYGAYDSAEKAFAGALKKAMENGTLTHYQGEWNGTAESFLTNPRWNGEGKISANHSNVGKNAHDLQRWEAILAGENKYLKVRKFLPSDLAAHGLSTKFRIRDDMYLVSIRRGLGEDISYISAGVILHRQPQPNDRIPLSYFITRKKGLKLEVHFYLAVSTEKAVSTGSDVVYVLPCWEKGEGGVISARWRNSTTSESGVLVFPHIISSAQEHASGLDQVVSRQLGAYNTVRVGYGLEAEKRSNLRYIGRPFNPVLKPKEGVDLKAALTIVAEEFRHLEKVSGPHGGGGEEGTRDMVEAVFLKMKEYFTFSDRAQGLDFTTGWMFRQRFQHLYPWAVNERSSSLLHRREIARVFATQVLKNAMELHIPDTDYRTRNMSEEQKLASPSELLSVLKNYAEGKGIRPIPEAEDVISANLKEPDKSV